MDFQSLREHATPMPNNYNMNRFRFNDHQNTYTNRTNNGQHPTNRNDRNRSTINHNNTQSNMQRRGNMRMNESYMRRNYNHEFAEQNCNEYVRKNLNESFNESEFAKNKPNNPNSENISYLSSENLKKLNDSFESEKNNFNNCGPSNSNWPQNYNNNAQYDNDIQPKNIKRCPPNHNEYDHASIPAIEEDIDIGPVNSIINNNRNVNNMNKYGKKEDIKYAFNIIEEMKKELNKLKTDISTRGSESEMLKERVVCLQLQNNLYNHNIFNSSKQESLYSDNNRMDNKQKTMQNRRNRKRKFNDMDSINENNANHFMNDKNDYTFTKKRRMHQQFSG